MLRKSNSVGWIGCASKCKPSHTLGYNKKLRPMNEEHYCNLNCAKTIVLCIHSFSIVNL